MNHTFRFHFQRYACGIIVPRSYDVVERKELLNHMLRFYFQRYACGIIVPRSSDVVEGKELLNHMLRFYFQRYACGIITLSQERNQHKMMKSTIRKSTYQAIYRLLDLVSPSPLTAGTSAMRPAATAANDEDLGIYLLREKINCICTMRAGFTGAAKSGRF